MLDILWSYLLLIAVIGGFVGGIIGGRKLLARRTSREQALVQCSDLLMLGRAYMLKNKFVGDEHGPGAAETFGDAAALQEKHAITDDELGLAEGVTLDTMILSAIRHNGEAKEKSA